MIRDEVWRNDRFACMSMLNVSILHKVQLLHHHQHVVSFHVAPQLLTAVQMHISRNRVSNLACLFLADEMTSGAFVRSVAVQLETAAVVADMMTLSMFEAERRLFQALA